ncbi:MAG TPA: AIM24 family protein [bacterium]
MTDAAAALQRARELFQQGDARQAEEIVDRLVAENPRSTTALNFRAYLIYRRGDMDGALAAYRRLTELEPRVAGHLANLGLICFKGQRYLEAQAAFERQLELDPDDVKALRNLGFCLERQQSLEKALDCFTRAGDEENAEKVRCRLVPRGEAVARGEDAGTVATGRAGGARRPRADGSGAPEAALEPEVGDWLSGLSLPQPGEGPELVRAGAGALLAQVREKVFVNTFFCAGHRGVVVFAPAFREAGKAASKFGERHGVLARAEGNGELVLAGGGRGLHALHLAGGRLFVNHAALVACGTEITVSFEFAGFLKGRFLAVELSGAGSVVLAVRGTPVVLPMLPDQPTLVRPDAVVAWTEQLAYDTEVVPELKRLTGKDEALRYRFEGRGHLVLQDG